MELNNISCVGVVGAGLMGHGIAQVFGSAGYKVNIYDTDAAMLMAVRDRIASNFKVSRALGLTSPADMEKCLDKINICGSIEELCNGPQFIIESILENLDIKRKVMGEIEQFTPADTILTSNTSAISITEIGKALIHKGRFLGTHFWNPPHVLPCVEVIRGDATGEDIFAMVFAFMEKVGKIPVRVLKDVPGFLGNRLQHAMWREAISLYEAGVAGAEDIDKVVKFGFGARMPFIGPLETADLAGLPLVLDVHRYLFPYLDTAAQPSPVLESLVAAGAKGVRSGRGFYEWTPEMIRQTIEQRDTVLLRILHEITGKVKREQAQGD